MDKIKLYPMNVGDIDCNREEEYILFDAGSDIELKFDSSGCREVRRGNTLLMLATFQKYDVFKADSYLIWEPSYFEFASGDRLNKRKEVWCRDPRLLMCAFLKRWVATKLSKYYYERDDINWRALRQAWTEDCNKLINPLPSMEEARSFLKPNYLLRDDLIVTVVPIPEIVPGDENLPKPEDYVNVPAEFQALVEKYQDR